MLMLGNVGKPATALLAVSALLLAPLSVLIPDQAHALEVMAEGTSQANADMAVTEKTLEEVTAPSDYMNEVSATAEEVREAEEQIVAVDEEPVVSGAQDVSLARALVSSSTAVLGVTFPLSNADDSVEISYRARNGEQWGQWHVMELADAGQAPATANSMTLGTEPVPLTNIDEVEVAVRTADGRTLPGAILTVIEPELTPAELQDTQVALHGQRAIEAIESLLDDVTETNNAQEESKAAQGRQEASTNSTRDKLTPTLPAEDSPLTPAEVAEASATLQVPGGAHAGNRAMGAIGFIRAAGPSADGTSYITDLPWLTITTRKGWGANERVMDWDPEKTTFKGAVVHHTAGSNDYTKEQVPDVIRGIYRYHAVSLGWGDVGYHLLVDKFGGVWEGRAGGLTKAVQGGHAYGANSTTFGISVLGDYMKVTPSNEAIDAVAKAVAWKLNVHGINNMNATFTTKGNQWGKSSVTLPVVSAHRQVGGTTCPGDAFMTRWDELIGKVKTYHAHIIDQQKATQPTLQKPVSAATSNFAEKQAQWAAKKHMGTYWHTGIALYGGAMSAAGQTDALLIDRRGDFWLYPGRNHGKLGARWNIGNSWTNLDQITSGMDFDGDKIPDVVGRLKRTGELLLYPGNGQGKLKPSRKIGSGWGAFTTIRVVSNVVNKRPVVYAVDRAGVLRLYHTDGKGNFTRSERLGSGWEAMKGFVSVGDKSGNGHSDMLVIDGKGDAWVYEGNGKGTFYDRAKVASGWRIYAQIVSAGDSGHIWTVTSDGYFTHHELRGLR